MPPEKQSVNNVEVAEVTFDLTDQQERVVLQIRQRFSTDTNGIACSATPFFHHKHIIYPHIFNKHHF